MTATRSEGVIERLRWSAIPLSSCKRASVDPGNVNKNDAYSFLTRESNPLRITVALCLIILAALIPKQSILAQSTTCEADMVANDQNDIWSEECYLNDDCMEQGNPCQANDVNLIGAFLADSLGNPILACNCGDPQMAFLWGRFENGTNTSRYAVRARTEVWLDSMYAVELIACSFDELPPGAQDVALLGVFNFTCCQVVQLLNTWVAWETSAAVCSDPMDPGYIEVCNEYAPSKCSKELGFIDFLSPNFEYACGATTDSTTEICFMDMTIGGTPPYTYKWFFGDGDSSTMMNPCHTYDATSGTFFVTLVVTDTANIQAGAILEVNLDSLDCCTLELECPSASLPVLNCVNAIPAPSPDSIAILDMCGMMVDITIVDDTTGMGCIGDTMEVTRTYYIVDDMFSDTCVQVFRVVDDVPPVLTCPPAVTVSCEDSVDPMSTGTPSAQDDSCDADPDLMFSDQMLSGDCPHETTVVRTWTATDACGNTGTCVQMISIQDETPPEITCPANVFVAFGESIDPADTGNATASDNCDDDPFITYQDNSDPEPCMTIIRTWLATDTCGNIATCQQFIMVGDTVPFMLSCPEDVTLACNEDPDNIPVLTTESSCFTIEYFDDLMTSDDCAEGYFAKITRTYVATDVSGNVMTCTQMILFEPLDLEDVDFPPDLKGPDALSCVPPPDTSPEATGEPEINGMPILNNLVCNISAIYNDETAPLCGGGYKIFRTWLVTDWCTGAVLDSVQVIEVADKTPPFINAPDSLFVSAGPGCEADVLAPPAEVTEDCSDEVDVRIQGDFGTILGNGGLIPDLPLGVHIVIYIATNDCLAESRDTMIVVVVDDLPPGPICKASVVIPLGNDGMVTVSASVFDAGSANHCGPVFFKARRMDAPQDFDCFVPGNPFYQFDDVIKFCCEDVGNDDLMVILRVYDVPPVAGPVPDDYLQGHFADCMVRVEIQDKIPPMIQCPSDLTISCEFDFDPDNLSIFGDVVTNPADQEEICIDDQGNPYTFGLTCIGIDGLAQDNCDVTISHTPVFDILDNCGTGLIRRIFTATDAGGLTATCEQTITIINYLPFTESDISWPPDYTTSDICQVDLLDPVDLPPPFDQPTFDEDECELIGVTFNDVVFDFSGSHQACFKILRTWTVIDWCQYQTGGSAGIWTYIQVIKVANTVGPEIVVGPDFETCTDDAACGPGNVQLEASASDDCSGPDALQWTIGVDLDNNGSLNQIFTPLGDEVLVDVQLPLGTHRILYSVEDFCGNVTTEEQFITMVSCKPPSAKCRNLTTTLMPVDTNGDGEADWGMVTLWANDLDAGSDHPCGNPIQLAFSADPNDNSIVFDCSDLGNNAVQLWVIDDQGNTDFCIVTITIQDNSDVCPDDPVQRALISGHIATSIAESVPGVSVSLHGSNLTPQSTDLNGAYLFPAMPYGGSYRIEPYLNTDHKKGVSTLDLIVLQKHLLGLKLLDDPYRIVAADANRSQSLSATDIVVLRRLILGITGTLPNNTSWRFIDAGYQFIDETNPLAEIFPESYEIPSLDGDMDINFVAVKVGDLNGSAMGGLQNDPIQMRSAPSGPDLIVKDRMLTTGQTALVQIRCADLDEVEALQFTLEWDQDLVRIMPVEDPGSTLSSSQWTTEYLDRGWLPVSWTRYDNDATDQDVFLTLEVVAKTDIALYASGLRIGDRITSVEGQDVSGRFVQPRLSVLPMTGDVVALRVYQNRPNPFTRKTLIPLSLPEMDHVRVDIYNAGGDLVQHMIIEMPAGYNEIMLDAAQFGQPGVYACAISTSRDARTLRMIVVGE